ncbi:MAG TPA: WYL domain-containing protein [Iamia sp.]|nr:WYL domain-containing protein [Iamia sp.]
MSTEKVERLMTLLQVLLDAGSPITAQEIRARVPGYSDDAVAFRRAFERDKAELGDLLGHPIRAEAVPGVDPPQEGYRLRPADAYLRDPGLTPEERRAVAVAASAVRLSGIDPRRATAKVGADAEDDRGAAGGATRTELPADEAVVTLFQAVTERRAATFRYRDEERVVHPQRLRFTRGRWYLDAFDTTRDGDRLFRLDRIQGDVAVGERDAFPARARGPVDDMLDAPWALGDGPAQEVRIRFTPARAEAARRAAPRGRATVEDDGSLVLALDVRMVPALRTFVLGFGEDAEVLSPPAVRADIVAWLEAIAARGTS